MRNRSLIALLVLVLLAAAGAGVQDYRFDLEIAAERERAARVRHDLATLDVTLADWRAAQAAYLATGQGPSFWMSRATDLATAVEAGVQRRLGAAPDDAAAAHYESAAALLAELNLLDGRAREFIATEQRFNASDVIFMESLDAARRLAGVLAAARNAEHAASEARVTDLRRLRFGLHVSALVMLVFASLAFFRRAVRPREAVAEPAGGGLSLRDAAPAAAPPPPVDLAGVAELCGDLARVPDGRGLPPLLARAADVLDARGLVLWIAEAGGAVLRPSLSHGYSERVLARIGSLQVDGDNVTSLAYRSLRPQILNGAPGAAAAIAVPVITSAGCMGVLAAEINVPRPGPDAIAAARMIAAQLAALVAPAAGDAPAAHAAEA